MKLRKEISILSLLVLGLFLPGLPACGGNDAGDDVDEAMEEVQDEMQDAKEEIEDEVDDHS